MADATPKAQELADENGIDIDSLDGSGADGRVLVEDVEKAIEAKDEGSDESSEDAPEVKGDELVEPVSADKSADAYLEHPHVDLDDQSEVEKKDLTAATDQVQLPGEEPLEVEEEPVADDAGEAVAEVAKEGESDDPDPSLLLSQDDILSRGERERGFYVIPEQVNPNYVAAQKAAEEAEVSDSSSDSKQSGEDSPNTDAVKETARPAQQEGVVDTSDPGGSPTAGESLKDKAPAVAEATEGSGSDKDE